MDTLEDRPARPLIIKCGYDSSTRKVTFPSAINCRLETVRARVEDCFHLSALSFALTYTDDDGEEFSIRNEIDLTEAILYFASGDDEAVGSACSGASGSQPIVTLRLEVAIEYDGPSLSDTSSLRSFESGTGSGDLQSGSSWRSSSYHTGSHRSGASSRADVDDLEDSLTVLGLDQRSTTSRTGVAPVLMPQSELGSRWLREQSSLARRTGVPRVRRNSNDDEEDSSDLGDLNLVRDPRGKLYYSYGSNGSTTSEDDYNARASYLPPRPDIPVTGLAIEPGAPPVLAPDCSACGKRLDYMRYVCVICGEGDMWKENASGKLPFVPPYLPSVTATSEGSDQNVSSSSSTIYGIRPRSESTSTRASMEALNGMLPTPQHSPTHAPVDHTSNSGYELCPACIEEHGIAHAKAAAKLARSQRETGLIPVRRRGRHAFREKIWGLEGWTDIEYNDDMQCTICHTETRRHRFKCVSCPNFNMCRSCYQRVGEIHPAHAFLSLPDQVQPTPEVRGQPAGMPLPMRHPGAFCHNCLQDIVGPRFHCAVCPSWDLCIQCEGISASSGGHTPDHIMMKIPVPIAATQIEAVSRRARERWLQDSVAASSRSSSPTDDTVYASAPASIADALNHHLRCKGCNEWILGKRFQCANCPSLPDAYSLCSICELRSYRIHDPRHVFFKFDRPVHFPLASVEPVLPILLRNRVGDIPAGSVLDNRDPSAYLQYLLHRETLCDIHADQIRGTWLRCAHCPAGFDICAEAEAIAEHDPTHVFIAFKARVDMNRFRETANLGGERPRALLEHVVYTF